MLFHIILTFSALVCDGACSSVFAIPIQDEFSKLFVFFPHLSQSGGYLIHSGGRGVNIRKNTFWHKILILAKNNRAMNEEFF